jgi:hypothetical protein
VSCVTLRWSSKKCKVAIPALVPAATIGVACLPSIFGMRAGMCRVYRDDGGIGVWSNRMLGGICSVLSPAQEPEVLLLVGGVAELRANSVVC